MNQKTLTKLEYDKIISLLVDQASSETGKNRCRSLKPMIDLEENIKVVAEDEDDELEIEFFDLDD